MCRFISKMRSLICENYRLITFCVLGAITVLSLSPLPELPSVPGNDKTHHVLAYAFLMLPIALRRPRYWAGFGLLFLAWSAGIELVQPYVNRYGEWNDLLANLTGLILGVAIGVVLNSIDKLK